MARDVWALGPGGVAGLPGRAGAAGQAAVAAAELRVHAAVPLPPRGAGRGHLRTHPPGEGAAVPAAATRLRGPCAAELVEVMYPRLHLLRGTASHLENLLQKNI